MKRTTKRNRWSKCSYKLVASFIILVFIVLADQTGASHIVNSESRSFLLAEKQIAEAQRKSSDIHSESSHESLAKSDSKSASQVNTAALSTADSKSVLAAAAKKTANRVYLTFDDGPGKYTEEVLDILEKYDVPATFFVLGKQVEVYPELISRMYEKGYVIGNHTYDHEYDKLYRSFPDFFSQIKQTEDAVRLITGERPKLVRAPGGTYGHFDTTYFDLMKQAGYIVTDWNVDSGDSLKAGVPAKEIIKNATISNVRGDRVVLMHDGGSHAETVKALPAIIEYYKKQNYEFTSLDPLQEPVQFKVKSQSSGDKKIQPSKEWINNNIAPNAALFGEGPSLVVEVGKLVTKLAPGEYRLEDGQLMVPLRVIVERYGGNVKWNNTDQSATVKWAGNEIKVSLDNQLLASTEGRVEMKSGTLWVSLRDLLSAANYKVKSMDRNESELIIIAN